MVRWDEFIVNGEPAGRFFSFRERDTDRILDILVSLPLPVAPSS
jgi:hypothetical protein